MVREGHELASIASNVVVKIAANSGRVKSLQGAVCPEYQNQCHIVLFLLIRRCSRPKLARHISRPSLDAWMISISMALISSKRSETIYDNYSFTTKILAASIRNPLHVKDCALIGADVVTAPPNVISALASHVLTDKGLAAFPERRRDSGD